MQKLHEFAVIAAGVVGAFRLPGMGVERSPSPCAGTRPQLYRIWYEIELDKFAGNLAG